MVIETRARSNSKEFSKETPISPRKRSDSFTRKKKIVKRFQTRDALLDVANQDKTNVANQDKTTQNLYGLYNFALILIFYYILTSSLRKWFSNESIFGGGDLFLHLIADGDTFGLLISFFLMCTFSFNAFILQIAIVNGLVGRTFSFFLQHTTQFVLIFGSVLIAFLRDWPVLPTVAFVMQSLVLFMKMHSYISINRYLSDLKGDIKKNDSDTSKFTEEQLDLASRYPSNITIKDYILFSFSPSLVYHPNFPRTDKIRIAYLIEKAAIIFATVSVLYFIHEDFSVPTLRQLSSLYFVDALSRLIVPYAVSWVLVFVIIFEGVCNFFAELTFFADRHFYDDWWNSISFEEFARKWNKPVHDFLLRHVYFEAIDKWGSKSRAMFLTFLFSSFFHELILGIGFKTFHPVLFSFQILQLPIIAVQTLPIFKNNPRRSNLFFWFSIMLGPPLILSLYSRDYCLRHNTCFA